MTGGASRGSETGLEAIERAAVRSWPALVTVEVDGWLVRISSGGSVRANTVSALDYRGADLEASIARVVTCYAGHGAAARFTITEVDRPAGLDAALARRRFVREGCHLTMVRPLGATDIAAPPGGLDGGVEIADGPDAAWLAVYLAGLSDSRRAVAPRLVAGVPAPRAFFSCVRGAEVIASGLSVLDGPLASVQCMATRADVRRSGAAAAVLDAIAGWARDRGARALYLQAEADNVAALGLYERAGFRVAGRYHVRRCDGEGATAG